MMPEGWGPGESTHPIGVVYRNHRGEVSTRRIIPRDIRYGATRWHPELQWLLDCWDLDKNAERTYALRDCDFLADAALAAMPLAERRLSEQ